MSIKLRYLGLIITPMVFLMCCKNGPTEPYKEKILSYNVNQIKNEPIVFELLTSNIIYPDPTKNWYVPDEIVLFRNEPFKVELTNCSIVQRWICVIEDPVMKLVRCDTTTITDSTMTLSYHFLASEPCKCCIVFFVNPTIDNFYINQHPFAVEYTCCPVPSLELNLTHQDWLVDTTYFSELNLYLSGKTNASKIKVETYGDGLIGATSIYPKFDGSFSDTINILFSHVGGLVLKANTRIALYGAIGFPEIININNPNNH